MSQNASEYSYGNADNGGSVSAEPLFYAFVRPYVGDVLVVILIYTFIRIFLPEGGKWLPLYIFLFAAGVEILQLFHLVERLGLENSSLFRILIGSVFDITDILCYAVGGLLVVVGRYLYGRYAKRFQ